MSRTPTTGQHDQPNANSNQIGNGINNQIHQSTQSIQQSNRSTNTTPSNIVNNANEKSKPNVDANQQFN